MKSEDLQTLLLRVQEVVDRAGLSSDLRPAAFTKVFEVLREEASVNLRQEATTESPKVTDSDDVMQRVASKLGLDRSVLEDIYYLEGDLLEVTVPTGRLAKSKKGGAQQLALLVAAGRQAAGLDSEWTSSSRIRDVCNHYGKFDSSNFAFTLSHMDDIFQLRGKQQDREVRLRAQGYEKAAELIKSLITD